MKWGNVFYYYLCCHIYYCIPYNEKSDEKPQKKQTESWQHYWPLYFHCCNLALIAQMGLQVKGRYTPSFPGGRDIAGYHR